MPLCKEHIYYVSNVTALSHFNLQSVFAGVCGALTCMSMDAPDRPADLLDEFLVPGKPQCGEGRPQQSDEASAECNKTQNLETRAVLHSEGPCKRDMLVTSNSFIW